MAETCIVCLGDLGESGIESAHSPIKSTLTDDHDNATIKSATVVDSSEDNENKNIAHLLPCGHHLHDECLKPWVERANSCPICRQSFNEVELVTQIGGPVLSSYPVSDRTQVAEVDPTMIVDDIDEEPEEQPCPVCRDDDNEDVLLACDGCNAYYHTYCIGLDAVPPGHWFCENCDTQRAIESVCPISSERPAPRRHHTSDRRTRGQQRRIRHRNQASSSNWARVWQSVWDNLNLDLDFPFDEEVEQTQLERTQRAASQRRDFRQWERRLQVAESHGGANRFRETAPALLDMSSRRERPASSEPESREEIRAWNAFEKAKEIELDPAPKRKRKSTSASPSEMQTTPSVERPLKRPRTRRVVENGPGANSSPLDSRRSSATHPFTSRTSISGPSLTQTGGPSFLQSMLREIETSAGPDDKAGPAKLSIQPPSVLYGSPHPSSPGASPTASNHVSPRARSTTPPPSISPRPGSPLSLTSKIEPIFPRPEFSPNSSPADPILAHRAKPELRRVTRILQQDSSPPRSSETSPTRPNMPFSTKSDLQRMVATALKPHYQSNEVSKDQYTDINRSVSRLLYDKVGDAGYVNGEEKELYERIANDEVMKAVQGLKAET